ncbi:hypothetical protein BJD61_gp66 [Gordonia phage Obliviate]|uniref:hypothetical protein n=1 Tax=Gordonia phage Obliviate TaxID=1821559 RepID=UPI00078B9A66|nr:hypothetical protein BJD61_gp66 [Gordonia phage Obliviate]AMS03145.1 hypothetical protein SEA_OBLIVIATE_66 [Gordonia phage Obliviate]
MPLTETPHGLLDLTSVALDLTELVDSIPGVDEGLSHAEYTRQAAIYDAALVDAARRKYPEHVWHLEEPDRATVLIDREGIIWTFTDTDPENDFSEAEWTPHCWSVIHELVTTGPVCNDWTDVLDSGPVRTYVPEIDGPAVRRYRYRPGGAMADADPTEYLCDTFPLGGDR